MIKFIGSGDISQVSVDSYVAQLHGKYAYFLETAPVQAKYYSKDVNKSTSDGNLDSVVNIVGPQGAIRFNFIDNVPVYFESTTELSISKDEWGDEAADTTVTVTMLPGIIIPQVDDAFSIKVDKDTEILYTITDVEPSSIKGTSFYRVTIIVAEFSKSSLEKQVTGAFEVVETEPGSYAICDKRKTIIIRKLVEKLKPLAIPIKNMFYIGAVSSLGVRETGLRNDAYFIDRFLNFFVKNEIQHLDNLFPYIDIGDVIDSGNTDTIPHILARLFKYNNISNTTSSYMIPSKYQPTELDNSFSVMQADDLLDANFIDEIIEVANLDQVKNVLPYSEYENIATVPGVLNQLTWTLVNKPDTIDTFLETTLLNEPIRFSGTVEALYAIVIAFKLVDDYITRMVTDGYNEATNEQLGQIPDLN